MTSPNSGWRVTTQRQTQQLAAGGQFVPGVEVGFQTGLGVDGSVFVPNSQFTPEYVAAAVAAKASMLDQVASLQSGPSN